MASQRHSSMELVGSPVWVLSLRRAGPSCIRLIVNDNRPADHSGRAV
jgi:hypothetical protein